MYVGEEVDVINFKERSPNYTNCETTKHFSKIIMQQDILVD